MKIAVLVFKGWSVVRRFQSLLTHARALGHDVICLGSRHQRADEMIKGPLAEMGIQFYPRSEFRAALQSFDPDVVIGESLDDFEMATFQWAEEHRKVELLLDHDQLVPRDDYWGDYLAFLRRLQDCYPRIVLLTVNEKQKSLYQREGARVEAVGLPDLDLIKDHYDIQGIRARLGVEPNQTLVGFYPMLWPIRPKLHAYQNIEQEILAEFFRLANSEGWRVVAHPHPSLRFARNADGAGALWGGEKHYSYFRWMQGQGAYFVAGWNPGRIGELEFHLCDSFELMAAADCLMGTAPHIAWEALAMSKKYVNLLTPKYVQLWPTRHLAPNGEIWPNAVMETLDFKNTLRIVNENSGVFEDGPLAWEEWFYKLDQQAWRRILNLAEELHERSEN